MKNIFCTYPEHDAPTYLGGIPGPSLPLHKSGGFVEGTMILTRRGEKPINEISPGDRVQTFDHGTCEVLAVGRQHFSVRDLMLRPELRPVRVQGSISGAQGGLDVAEDHCILVRSRKSEGRHDEPDVLIRVSDLPRKWAQRPPISKSGITYYHLVLARHEMVMAGGIWCESLSLPDAEDIYPDRRAIWRQSPSQPLDEVFHMKGARRILSPSEAQRLTAKLARARKLQADQLSRFA